MVILGIVTSIVSSYFVFNAKLLNKVSNRWGAQSDNSLVATFITTQVRNATDLALINTAASPVSGYNYIYLDSIANTVKYIGTDGSTRNITTAPITGLSFELKKDVMGKNFLEFTISSRIGGAQTYQTSAEVALLNLRNLDPAANTVLRYNFSQ